jgi:adenylate cyclase
MREQRKLAAVLAADVVGYSQLMGRDEAGTLARLKEHRARCLEPALTRNGGRLVKLAGDGALAEFGSAVDALRAAIEFQRAVDQANAGQPEEQRILFRVGLHLGDLLVDGNDLYGDGVNVAARLEAEAPPGGIVLSGALHEAAAGRLEAGFTDLGRLSLKNIDRQVQAFRVEWARGAATLANPSVIVKRPAASLSGGKPSIAVLPFQNRSSDSQQEYFSDGISEDIITNLSKFHTFHVIGRNTSFAFKGNAPDVAAMGRELGVNYLVEGSVRSAGNRVRISAQLTDVASGAALWAERYDRELKDVFEVQDEITARIANAVDPAIRSDQTRRALGKHPADLRAWDHLLRGLWHLNRYKKEANAEARQEFEAAIACDPGFAAAHAWLAMTFVFEGWFNWTDAHADRLVRAGTSAAEAVRLDDTEAMAHAAMAMACFWATRMDQARHAAEQAVALNPNSFLGNFVCGGAHNYSGLCERAVPYHRKALDLSPNDPLAWNCLGSLAHTHLNLRQFAEAVVCADRALVQRHGYLFGRLVKVSALGHAGRIGEAKAAVNALFEVAPNFTLKLIDHYPFVLPSQKDHLLHGLGLAGLPMSVPDPTPPPAPALPPG